MATVVVLWRRDVLRFLRQRSRIIGALAQPLLFWLIIGSGLDKGFAAGVGGPGYREYFFPGVVAMVVLFTSVFSTMSIIEDRHAGFLQAVLVAPSPRVAIVLGKVMGGVSLALLQAAILIILAPWAGYPLGRISWMEIALFLALTSVALCAVGFAIAWRLDSIQGYHAVMSVLIIPAWILSGAMFPPRQAPAWMAAAMKANPLTYAVEGLRRALYGGAAPAGVGLEGGSLAVDLAVVGGFASLALALAAWTASRRG